MREASGGLERPRGWPIRRRQLPTRCSLIDSPTTTHRETELQLTPASDWGELTAAACFQGWSAEPVRTSTPAGADEATELPTATHASTAMHDTSLRAAAEAVTDWLDQRAPPLLVVRTSPCPLRDPLREVAVVPTTVQRTPATPLAVAVVDVVVVGAVVVDAVVGAAPDAVGEPDGVDDVVEVEVEVEVKGRAPLPVDEPVRQETALSVPTPLGMVTGAQVDPPSAVAAITPAT
jgi:hypothetical protein